MSLSFILKTPDHTLFAYSHSMILNHINHIYLGRIDALLLTFIRIFTYNITFSHSRESGNPLIKLILTWIPAFAGMTYC